MPKPAPEVKKLDFLAGEWIHSEVYQPSPMGPGGKGGARSNASWILGDHNLYIVYKSKSPAGLIEGRGVIGWDGEKKAYRMHWFDNLGLATAYTGNFSADGTLVFDGAYTFQGQAVKEQMSIKKQPDGNVLFTSSMVGPDGAPKTVMESMASPASKAAAPTATPTPRP